MEVSRQFAWFVFNWAIGCCRNTKSFLSLHGASYFNGTCKFALFCISLCASVHSKIVSWLIWIRDQTRAPSVSIIDLTSLFYTVTGWFTLSSRWKATFSTFCNLSIWSELLMILLSGMLTSLLLWLFNGWRSLVNISRLCCPTRTSNFLSPRFKSADHVAWRQRGLISLISPKMRAGRIKI